MAWTKNGEQHHFSLLTEEDVYLARQLRAYGLQLLAEADALRERERQLRQEADALNVKRIAEKFEVAYTTMRKCLSGETWQSVPFPDLDGTGNDSHDTQP